MDSNLNEDSTEADDANHNEFTDENEDAVSESINSYIFQFII